MSARSVSSPQPALSLRRIWLIARRDYFGYIKTWGFWLSFLMPFLFGAFGVFAAQTGLDFQSKRYETVLDETGQGVGAAMIDDYYAQLAETAAEMIDELPENMREPARERIEAEGTKNLVFVPLPAETMDALQPYLKGDRQIIHEGSQVPLHGVLQIYPENGQARARYWSSNVNANTVPAIARRYFRKRARQNYLETGGLTLEGLDSATDMAPIETFDPLKPMEEDMEEQVVTDTDRLPFFVAAMAAAFLWFTIFSGAYMLLTSMLEEKLGKLMEMMLATTRLAEIMLGKLIGIALLTLTALAPYIILGTLVVIAFMVTGPPELVEGVRQAITLKMLIFFPVFLLLGYTFYGCLFIALGSLADSMQDAQTLTIPVLLVLTACVLIIPAGLADPNAPIVLFASWFPLSAPFAAIVRLPTDPSWAELIGAAFVMCLATVGVAWLATQVFRHGILSGGGTKIVRNWFKRKVLRQSVT